MREKSPDQAHRLLVEYEHLNKDLPKDTRRLMGMFVIAHKVGHRGLKGVFGDVGQTPFRHRAWLWWNALRLSGLGHYWDDFVDRRNQGTSMHECLMWLRDQASDSEWETLSSRMGKEGRLNPHRYHRWPDSEGKERRTIWTKGGTWWKGDNFTKIILMGEHLPTRIPQNTWQERLGPHGVRKIESELHNLIDSDKMLQPDAKKRAVDYVRSRIPEILGYEIDNASYRTAAWFFQTDVPDEGGYFFSYKNMDEVPKRKSSNGRRWRWTWTGS